MTGDGTHQAAKAPASGVAQAQQANQIRAVGMEGQVGVGLVASDVGVGDALACIQDIAQQIAAGILRPRPTDVGSDALIDGAGVFFRIAIYGKPAHQDEAAAIDEFIGQYGQLPG